MRLLSSDRKGERSPGTALSEKAASTRRRALLCGWIAAALLAAPVAADISGTVFRDVDLDGVNDGGIESGVAGITVQAFAGGNTPVDSDVTAADGTYNLTLGAGNYRVEFIIPAALNHFQPGASLSGSGNTSVVFAANGATGVDFGVTNPGQYCQSDPTLAVNCYLKGDQTVFTAAGEDVLVSFPYNAGCADEDLNGVCDAGSVDVPTPTEVARGAQIGTTWGLAYQRTTDSLFAASFMKRHSGFRNFGETGHIYRIDDASGTPTVSLYLDLDSVAGISTVGGGGDPHPQPTDTCGNANDNDTCWAYDPASYAEVGKISLGDMDIADDESFLYVTNLFENTLIEIPVQASAPTTATEFALPTPACTGNLRPGAVAFEDGLVYVGQVCDGPTIADLVAYVHTFDPDTDTFSGAPVFQMDLDYVRGIVVDAGAGGSIQAEWQPWSDDYADVFGPVFGTERAYPQPWLLDIDFDEGDLLLGFMDRFGHQSSFDDNEPDPDYDTNGNTTLLRGDAAGDLLRACSNGAGWTLEANASCGGTATAGAGTGQGPANGEYYFEDALTGIHDEVILAGLFQVPINDDLTLSVYDPLNSAAGVDVFSGGMHWYRHSDGERDNQYRLFLRSNPDTFGKAGGLGDVEGLCDPAPLEIGNRIWNDGDADGVQDPLEAGLNGVTVVLLEDTDGDCSTTGDQTQVGSTVTAGDGEYLFTDANVTGGLQYETNYCLRVDTTQGALAGFNPTLLDAAPVGDGNDDLRDSDGDSTILAGFSITPVTTGGAGNNRHVYDFGFRALEFDWGDLPDGPYATLAASNGPNHEITGVGNTCIGTDPDSETDGQPNATATGDDTDVNGDDEDGVVFLDPLTPGAAADIQVTGCASTGGGADGIGILNAWIDFNSDGDFADAGEQIAANLDIASGVNTINIAAVPAGATGTMAARFRITDAAGQGGDAVTGAASTGEVEDYVLGAIGDFVWIDNGAGGGTAGDGIQDAGEPGLPGVIVNLLDGANNPVLDANGVPITTTTALDGSYEFPGLPAGTYRLEFVEPASFDPTLQNIGSDLTDSDADPVTGITGDVIVGVGTNDTSVDAGFIPESLICETGVPYTIDFERDAANVSIASGATVDNQWAAIGVTFALESVNGGGTGPLMIFDSNVASGGDPDLASPNDTCDDGLNNGTLPGVGTGGEVGQAGENCTALDNILIISEDGDASDPDDNGTGGFFTIDFATPIYISGVQVIDDSEWDVESRDAAGNLLSSVPTIPDFGDNSVETVVVNTDGVSQLRIGGPTSGGLTRVDLCVPPAAIGNYVWVDENSDGLQDAGEPGIPNAVVQLSEDTDGDGVPDTVVATTATDTAGGYLFPGLLPSAAYFVDVFDGTDATANTLPAGLTQTTPSTNPTSDFGNQDHSGNGYPVTAGLGEENLTADFGYNYNPDTDVNGGTNTAAIGDKVWIDADGDGVQDPNELGLAGVTVDLLCAGPDGEFGTGDDVAASTTTDATGNYLFDGLTPSACTVTVTPPAGYTQTGDPDDFGQPAGAPDNTTTDPIILGPGDVFLNADFGYQPPADQDNTVGDTVWSDTDGDGVLDAGEPGIPGVTVKLALDLDGDGIWEPLGNDGVPGGGDDEPIVASDITDANGNYLFDGVPDGNYVVCVTDTDNILDGQLNTGDPDDDGVPGNGDEDGAGAVSLDPTSADPNPVVDLDQDFGYTDPTQDPGEGGIGDTVFLDANANGAPDDGEGIEGVTVNLYTDPDGIPNNGDEVLIASTVTDENGNYFFGNLDPAETYMVEVDTTTLPPGLTNSVDPDGGNDSLSGVDLNTTGPIDLDQDFGYVPAGASGSIGNLVWQDTNADGINDGPNGPDGIPGNDDDEPGLPGKTLDLYYDANGNGLVDPGEPKIGSTVTDANGNYLFQNLPVDDGGGSYDYVVDVTDTMDMLGGYWHSLGDQSQAVDDTSKSDTYGVTLTPGTPDVLTVDFGYYVDLAALGNRVWIDNDFNGLQDPTDPTGIPNVEVTLTITYPDATVVTLIRTTDTAGAYAFQNLLADEDYNGDGVAPEPTYEISIDLADADNIVALAGVGPSTMTDVNGNADDNRDSDDPAGVDAFATQGITDMTVNAADPTTENDVEATYDFGFRALEFDWGDLPDGPYATLSANNGANHETTSVGNVFLGTAPDTETDGQPTFDALGDDNDLNGDDEDGVVFLHPVHPGASVDIQITGGATTGTNADGVGILNAWIDFNSDGDFADAGEQIASNFDVEAGAGPNNIINIASVPAGATGVMAARFRITTAVGQGGDAVTGSATTGEVEDYVLSTLGNLVWNDSIDGDGEYEPLGTDGLPGTGDEEPPVPNVTVQLVDPITFAPITDALGANIEAVTDANGIYEFPGLPPGDYRVLFIRPAGFEDFTPENLAGGDDTIDSDAEQVSDTNEGLAPVATDPPITMTAGEVDTTVDAGLRAITAALITSVTAYDDGGSVVFEFSTGYEALTAGFEVLRRDAELRDWVPVTDGLVPALVGAPQGGVYRVADERAPLADTLRYLIVEHQADGGSQLYGPYDVKLGRRGERATLEESAIAMPNVSERFADRMTAARAAAVRKDDDRSLRGIGSGQPPTSQVLQVDVEETGLYRVSAAELAAASGVRESGVRRLLMQGMVAVENQGRRISWIPEGRQGDGLYFYGEAIDSLYTRYNVYRVTLDERGVRVGRVENDYPTPAPGGIFQSIERFEEDLLPVINTTVITEADPWFWDGINAASTNNTRSFEVTVPDGATGQAEITVALKGGTNGPAALDHSATLRVNGAEVGTTAWSGKERHEATFAFDAALLGATTTFEVEGTLENGSTASIFFIDRFELDYPRFYRAVDDALVARADGNAVVTIEGLSSVDVAVLDISDPAAPKEVRNVRAEFGPGGVQASFTPGKGEEEYFVTTFPSARPVSGLRAVVPAVDLLDSSLAVEHLVVAPAEWMSEAERLAVHRNGQGLSSMAVSLTDVYDAFSDGIVTPWAIHELLDYATANWIEAPRYVVLAGRGTFDPRDLQGNGDSFLPIVLVGTPYGLVGSDNILADLVGDDAVPEVAIGRLPIVSSDEFAAYNDKVEAYDVSSGPWQGRAILVADNPDAAGQFTSESNTIAGLWPSYEQTSIHLEEMTTADARAALQAAWNDGAQLVNYVGHAGVTQFAAENVLGIHDMELLANGDRLPVVSALTCIAGRSDIPMVESVAEALVTDADGGAIAVWSPSGISFGGAAHRLNVLYATALKDSPGATLGEIFLTTTGQFGLEGGPVEMLYAYGVTGDPAVELP